MLFGLILIAFSVFLDEFLGFTLISEIMLLVFYVPLQSLFFRRLHDTGVSGWWMLLQVTVVGVIPLYLWLIKSSKTENNKYINQVRINIWHKLYLSLYIISTLVLIPIQTYKIPAGSLFPTIMIGDRIVSSKVWSTENLKRSDMIVFPYPHDPSIDYIKRVIGLPGEIIEIRKDLVFINGELIDEPYAYFEPKERSSREAQGLIDAVPVSRFGPIVIPEGKLFVMGDNRYNSADSRYWGFVELKTVKSKAWFIYWSKNSDTDTFEGINFDRIFKKIE
jgi:signal peptidase I